MEEIAYFIWDSTRVTKFTIDKDDANLASIFSKLINKYNKNILGAFIVNDEYLKTIVQEYIDNSKELGSTWKFMLFETVDDASAWISS